MIESALARLPYPKNQEQTCSCNGLQWHTSEDGYNWLTISELKKGLEIIEFIPPTISQPEPEANREFHVKEKNEENRLMCLWKGV